MRSARGAYDIDRVCADRCAEIDRTTWYIVLLPSIVYITLLGGLLQIIRNFRLWGPLPFGKKLKNDCIVSGMFSLGYPAQLSSKNTSPPNETAVVCSHPPLSMFRTRVLARDNFSSWPQMRLRLRLFARLPRRACVSISLHPRECVVVTQAEERREHAVENVPPPLFAVKFPASIYPQK